MKKCFKCGKKKELGEFYRHKQMADGHLGKCKACTKIDSQASRWSRIDKVRAYDRKRGKLQKRIGANTERTKIFRERFPARYKAHNAVNNAVRDGRLKRPDRCSLCLKKGPVEGHHENYKKLLEVDWLCACCHRQLHRDNGGERK